MATSSTWTWKGRAFDAGQHLEESNRRRAAAPPGEPYAASKSVAVFPWGLSGDLAVVPRSLGCCESKRRHEGGAPRGGPGSCCATSSPPVTRLVAGFAAGALLRQGEREPTLMRLPRTPLARTFTGTRSKTSSQLLSELDECLATQGELQRQLDELRKEHDELKYELEVRAKIIRELELKIRVQLEVEIKVRLELEECRKEHGELESELQVRVKIILGLELKLKLLLEVEIKIRLELEECRETNDELQKQLDECEKEKVTLESELEACEVEEGRLHGQLEDARKTVGVLEEANEAARKAYDADKAKIMKEIEELKKMVCLVCWFHGGVVKENGEFENMKDVTRIVAYALVDLKTDMEWDQFKRLVEQASVPYLDVVVASRKTAGREGGRELVPQLGIQESTISQLGIGVIQQEQMQSKETECADDSDSETFSFDEIEPGTAHDYFPNEVFEMEEADQDDDDISEGSDGGDDNDGMAHPRFPLLELAYDDTHRAHMIAD
ncbi:hypothetical protein HU200_008840 [Digitaria exilis]|uniref:Uncharacterized protein n=1 Tax=Digitaria exilis TaxID=1010633 RepID=A0A835FLV1_9POAL|nr:hypothetical protein HU200_008840 [Digitaria exilis]